MSSPDHALPASLLSRREAIQRTAALLGLVFAPALLSRALQAQSAPAAAGAFTAAQRALLAALAERILPRTDTPGALDVGVPAFIELMHGAYLTADEKAAFESALARFEAAAQQAHQRNFSELSAEQQSALLTAAAESKADREHFLCIRELTIVGYFTSETVGKTVLHYDPVPGVFQPCIPLSEVGNAAWTWSR